MNSKANEQVLTALQRVVGATLKNWLDENKADVIEALRAAMPTPQKPSRRPRWRGRRGSLSF